MTLWTYVDNMRVTSSQDFVGKMGNVTDFQSMCVYTQSSTACLLDVDNMRVTSSQDFVGKMGNVTDFQSMCVYTQSSTACPLDATPGNTKQLLVFHVRYLQHNYVPDYSHDHCGISHHTYYNIGTSM